MHTPPIINPAHAWAVAGTAPIHQVLVWNTVFSQGKGYVFFSRKVANGNIALAGFLLDMYCLGVKDALYKILPLADYEKHCEFFRQNVGDYSQEEPAFARKLVEGAIAAAAELGFAAHEDYQVAKHIFGDVDTNNCMKIFNYRLNDKPFYEKGPNESLAMQQGIINQLAKHCGADGFLHNTTLKVSA